MGNTILRAHAKLNLNLHVLPGRDDRGFYRVRFVNAQTELADLVSISDSGAPGVHVDPPMVDSRENLAARAARTVLERCGIHAGVELRIEKHVPLRAGLGGGSADAAAVINGMDLHFELGLTGDEKNEIARELGMDVCYCVEGGLCSVSGTGERIERLPHTLPELALLIATPEQRKQSTAWAYSTLHDHEIGKRLDRYEGLLAAIIAGNVGGIARNLHNDFQLPVGSRYPLVNRIREAMEAGGALGALLAGSGLSVFGIFERRGDMERVGEELAKQGVRCIITRTI
jgi:4-diphosphocytidyl-2-C-methyl-D-erythritol kinase